MYISRNTITTEKLRRRYFNSLLVLFHLIEILGIRNGRSIWKLDFGRPVFAEMFISREYDDDRLRIPTIRLSKREWP